MESYQEDILYYEIGVSGKLCPKEDRLSKLSIKTLTVDDLVGENLKKLGKTLKNIKSRYEIEGLAITLTAYKMNELREGYSKGRPSDRFIGWVYLSNLLKGINKTLKAKKRKELRDLLYEKVEKLVIEDVKDKEKKGKKFNMTSSIYHVLSKKFFTHDYKHMKDNLKAFGEALEKVKLNYRRKRVEDELKRYKNLHPQIMEAMGTGLVVKQMMDEERTFKDALALTDRFK